MKKNIFIALIALVAFLMPMQSSGVAWAATPTYKYRFDDVFGPSGIEGQWVVVGTPTSPDLFGRESRVSRGNGTSTATWPSASLAQWMNGENAIIDTEADFVNSRDHVYSTNGLVTVSGPPIGYYNDTRPLPIDYIFMVVPDAGTRVAVDFRGPDPNLYDGDYPTLDVDIGGSDYFAVKSPGGRVERPSLNEPPENRFYFDLAKTRNTTRYETLRTYMRFQQVPYMASQALDIPLIIANVAAGDASDKPLRFHTILRTSNGGSMLSSGDIVASDLFNWEVDEDHEFSGNDWIFLSLGREDDEIDSQNVSYHLTTHVTNYCGIRYALHRYDRTNQQTNGTLFNAARWTMDLPADVDVDDIEGLGLPLDELSHIAPGMITTYEQFYSGTTAREKLFAIYPVDTLGPTSDPYRLWLNHTGRIIPGVSLDGDAVTEETFSVQPFRYLYSDRDFLVKAAETLKDPNSRVNISVEMPRQSASGYTLNLKDDSFSHGFVTADAPSTIQIDVDVPGSMQYDEESNPVVGLLPLHVTFKLRRSNQYVNPMWNDLLKEWKETGDIRRTFFDSFRLRMRTSDGVDDIDLSEWMDKQRVYDENVKVFMDEKNGNITVSLIAMLVSSKKGAPNFTLLADKSDGGTNRKYLTIWDRTDNDKWDITLYVSHIKSSSNPSPSPSEGGGGGGCSAGWSLAAGMVVTALLALGKRKEGDER